MIEKKLDKRHLPTKILKCKCCGVNLHSKPHKLGCHADPYSDFRIANKRKYKRTKLSIVDEPIEAMMYRQPADDMEIRCLVCGSAHNEKGEPFETWEDADTCCGDVYGKEFREEVERRLALDWNRQHKHRKRKNNNTE